MTATHATDRSPIRENDLFRDVKGLVWRVTVVGVGRNPCWLYCKSPCRMAALRKSEIRNAYTRVALRSPSSVEPK